MKKLISALLKKLGLLETRQEISKLVFLENSMFVPAGTTLIGSFDVNTPVIIGGVVQGSIKSNSGIKILSGGRIFNSTIDSVTVTNHGELDCISITAEKVTIEEGACVNGNSKITCNTLMVSEKSIFNAHIQCSQKHIH